MKPSLRTFAVLVLLACPAVAMPFQSNAPRGNRARSTAIEDVVQGLYISQFQEQVQVSDEQFVKILPLLRKGIETMRDNANRRLRATNRLKQLLQNGASDDDLNAQIRELDEAERLTKVNQESFIKFIDPFLNTEQKAKFRVFQSTFDQRLRELVLRARQPNQRNNAAPNQP
jgi:hypothetical protein